MPRPVGVIAAMPSAERVSNATLGVESSPGFPLALSLRGNDFELAA